MLKLDSIKIKHLTLNLSTKCNQNCKLCFAHHRVFNPNELMTLETAKRATSFFFNNRLPDYNSYSIMLFGGEPLLNFDIIPPYLKWLRKEYKDIHCDLNLFTNGLLLNKKRIKYFIKQRVNMHITYDSNYDYYSLGKNTTPENHKHVLSMIKSIVKINPYNVIPIYVINNDAPQNLQSYGENMNTIGIKSIFIVRKLFDKWTKLDIETILKISHKFRQNYGMKVIMGPEATFSCTDCYPQNLMVYPDGSIFDNCLTFGCALYNLGFVSKKNLFDTYYIGNIHSTIQSSSYNISNKRAFSHKRYSNSINTSCQTTYEDTSSFKSLWTDENS